MNFCTLFDINYLTRALVLYDSLKQHAKEFHLYIFAFDEKVPEVLAALKLPHTTVITLKEFEDEALLEVKPSRSPAEYCWTATSSTIRYILEKFQVTDCTYIDADLCFYSDPEVLLWEMGNKSILLTEHDYSPHYNQNLTAGKYCVQFMRFVANTDGLKALNWWRDRCLEWCYARHEDGKFGDQKYLDNWPEIFLGVHVLKHRGGGVAPWNVQKYHILKKETSLILEEKASKNKVSHTWSLVFYHFHGIRFYNDGTVGLDNYLLDNRVKEFLYIPYLRELMNWEKKLSLIFPKIVFRKNSDTPMFVIKLLSDIKNKIFGTFNYYKIKDI